MSDNTNNQEASSVPNITPAPARRLSITTHNLVTMQEKRLDTPIRTNNGRWSQEEHELFLQGYQKYGKSWKKIASMIRTRTLVQIRTHAQKFLQKTQHVGVKRPSPHSMQVPMFFPTMHQQMAAAMQHQQQLHHSPHAFIMPTPMVQHSPLPVNTSPASWDPILEDLEGITLDNLFSVAEEGEEAAASFDGKLDFEGKTGDDNNQDTEDAFNFDNDDLDWLTDCLSTTELDNLSINTASSSVSPPTVNTPSTRQLFPKPTPVQKSFTDPSLMKKRRLQPSTSNNNNKAQPLAAMPAPLEFNPFMWNSRQGFPSQF